MAALMSAQTSLGGAMYDMPRPARPRFKGVNTGRREYFQVEGTDIEKCERLDKAIEEYVGKIKSNTLYDVQGFAIPGNTLKATTKWFRKTLAECGFSPDTTADEMEMIVQKIAENKKEVEN